MNPDSTTRRPAAPARRPRPDQQPPRPLFSPLQAKARAKELAALVKEFLIQGEDYGRLNQAAKPSLFKPGAEKLCLTFGLAKKVEIVGRIEDWDGGFFHYLVKVSLISKSGGRLEAEGLGCCNTREARLAGPDAYALANTALKTAEKRALVDAVLAATSSSGLFAQDLEDFTDHTPGGPEPPSDPPETGGLTPGQILALKGTLKTAGLAEDDLLKKWGLQRLDQLRPGQLKSVLAWINARRNGHEV